MTFADTCMLYSVSEKLYQVKLCPFRAREQKIYKAAYLIWYFIFCCPCIM